MKPWSILGIPVFGVFLPFIGRRHLPLNRDGSFVDTNKALIEDEVGFYYIEPWTVEWLGFGLPISKAYVHLTSTGEVVTPDWQAAGA